MTSCSRIFLLSLLISLSNGFSGWSYNQDCRRIMIPFSMSSATTSESSESLLNSIDAVACFGRLADKAFVLPQTKVEGTAASGYEFGVLEAGRPKWMCTYIERTGKTQGGGNTMTHVPNWRSRLFGIDDNGDELLQNRAALKEALFSDIKFQMPLASPGGTFAAKEPLKNEAVVDAMWILLGGEHSDAPLSSETASKALQAAAIEHTDNSTQQQHDHLTYAVFEKAFLACGQ
mmetsp:Transcript_38210/g.42813  ORF Transcript_38210/g.42813 Transcript_38210/m.42813 type:complete len:232 (-) Transcript_38210:191-886(-)